MDSIENAYNRGFDDGVEWVVEWFENYINTLVRSEVEVVLLACAEDILEELKNTIDSM